MANSPEADSVPLGWMAEGGLAALDRLLEAIRGSSRKTVFFRMFEALNWAASIAVTLHERGTPVESELLQALRFVRNRVHHKWSYAIQQHGRSQAWRGQSRVVLGLASARATPPRQKGRAWRARVLRGVICTAVEPTLAARSPCTSLGSEGLGLDTWRRLPRSPESPFNRPRSVERSPASWPCPRPKAVCSSSTPEMRAEEAAPLTRAPLPRLAGCGARALRRQAVLRGAIVPPNPRLGVKRG